MDPFSMRTRRFFYQYNAWVIARGKELHMVLEKADETLIYASDVVEKFIKRFPRMDNLNMDVENENCEVGEVEVTNASKLEAGETACYIPQVHEDLTPKLGNNFASLDDAMEFYNAYAKEAGFSIRKWSEKKKGDEIIRKEFVCFKQGNGSLLEDVESSRRRGSIREGCKARLAVAKSDIGNFVVKVFDEGHSHKLTSPRKIQFLRSHRTVSSTQKCLVEDFDMVNMPKHQQYAFLGVQAGGFENIGCTQKDLYNYGRDKRNAVKGHDGELLHEYLQLEQMKNPSFTYKIEVDDEQRSTHCFWADATSRQNYSLYGDVVVFDTTYNTNQYEMIFAPLIGVNNHGQTFLFGAALLSDETIGSFVWLFSQFLQSMPGDAPKMIITDQDPTMTNAISQALPNTFHRYCIWHILNKFSEKLDVVKFKAYYNEFSNCIWNSKTKEDFVFVCLELIEKSGLKENKWLQSIFDIRTMWVPVYVNHVFSAGMSSSQRAESGHSFFKKFVGKNNSLVDFMVMFARALQKQRHEALLVDHKDSVEKPKLKMMHNILVQIVEVYTREMFFKFQDELIESFNYLFHFFTETNARLVYRTKRKGIPSDQGRELFYEKELDFASCSCNKFESIGIPCRHILVYLHKFHDFELLPNHYILKRWTKLAKGGTVMDSTRVKIVDDKSYFLEHSRLLQCCLGVIDKALTSQEAKEVLIDVLGSVKEKIKLLVGTSNKRTHQVVDSGTSAGILKNISSNDQPTYREPNQVRTKGCGKRLKGGKEIVVDKGNKTSGRRCHGCGLIGPGHNIISCPKVIVEQTIAPPDNGNDVSTGVSLSSP